MIQIFTTSRIQETKMRYDTNVYHLQNIGDKSNMIQMFTTSRIQEIKMRLQMFTTSRIQETKMLQNIGDKDANDTNVYHLQNIGDKDAI